MGCKYSSRQTLQLDLGYQPSSDSELDTPTPTKIKTSDDIFATTKNAMHCYFCFDKTGLLVKMPRCRCSFFAHPKCLVKFVEERRTFCSICKECYCDVVVGEPLSERMQRIMTIIKDQETFFKKRLFLNSIISVQ